MEFKPNDKAEVRLPAGWRAGRVKRVIPNYTLSGGTVYEIKGKIGGEDFVTISGPQSIRRL